MLGRANESQKNGKVVLKFRPAFAVLLEAFEYAQETGSDQWEFAVGIDEFQRLGLNENDLRWLVRKGFVEHAREITRLEDNGREFRRTGDLSFCESTGFVLTVVGAEQARQATLQNGESTTAFVDGERLVEGQDETPQEAARTTIPVWDTERRELRLNGHVVKQFKWSAANQETILAAFEEERWSFRIDDPLPPHPEQDSKRRLSDTIKCLNRKQTQELIHFRGDGTGEGVIWEMVAPG